MHLHRSKDKGSSGKRKKSRDPIPAHRHAVPSGPWPWIDTRDAVGPKLLNNEVPPVPKDCDHRGCGGACWKDYPKSRFPNWTKEQVVKCGIEDAIQKEIKSCKIYTLDVDKSAVFRNAESEWDCKGSNDELDSKWNWFKNNNQSSDVRIRVLFVEKMAGPVLRMLGGKYNIEPFFFSSSINWIPSHFQEDLRPGFGDHITITIPFVQSIAKDQLQDSDRVSTTDLLAGRSSLFWNPISKKAPLILDLTKQALILDLLSVHLIRNVSGNTMISFNTNKIFGCRDPVPNYLYQRILYAGRSVYWHKLLEQSDDPTIFLLIFVGHGIYAWDEALQHLYTEICVVEADALHVSESLNFTDMIHIMRAHLVQYSALLEMFKRTVSFIKDTPNPALNPEQKTNSDPLLDKECKTLLEEIERLDMECKTQNVRLKDVIEFVDSKSGQRETDAMKQVSYLTTFFLPATFMASIFAMNVQEINAGATTPLARYLETAFALTAATVWVLFALQSKHRFNKRLSILERIGWPVYFTYCLIQKIRYPEHSRSNKLKEVVAPETV